MLIALDHVIVAVRDPDRARNDYEKLLGVEASWTGVHPDAGTSNVLFRLENTYLELLAATGNGPVADLLRLRIESEGEGVAGVAFATDDIESCCRELRERGLEPGPVLEGEGRDTRTSAVRRWRRSSLPFDRTRGLLLFPIQHESTADALAMSSPRGEPAASVHALDHVVVQTADPERTRSLFLDGFGLRLAVDKEFPQWGVRLMFFRIGGITLEVAGALAGRSQEEVLRGSGEATGSGSDRFYGLSYRVRSIELAHKRLCSAGVDVSEIRAGRRPGTRVVTVRSGTCSVPTLLIEFEEGEPHSSERSG